MDSKEKEQIKPKENTNEVLERAKTFKKKKINVFLATLEDDIKTFHLDIMTS